MTDIDTLLQILERLKQIEELTKRVEKLEKEIEILKKTSKELAMNKITKDLTSKMDLRERLGLAANLAIKHYEVEPPKRRVSG
ncbi:MAG: hypothetical protein ACTSPB_10330 [Candidatus Thorarchaeota archaeon]